MPPQFGVFVTEKRRCLTARRWKFPESRWISSRRRAPAASLTMTGGFGSFCRRTRRTTTADAHPWAQGSCATSPATSCSVHITLRGCRRQDGSSLKPVTTIEIAAW